MQGVNSIDGFFRSDGTPLYVGFERRPEGPRIIIRYGRTLQKPVVRAVSCCAMPGHRSIGDIWQCVANIWCEILCVSTKGPEHQRFLAAWVPFAKRHKIETVLIEVVAFPVLNKGVLMDWNDIARKQYEWVERMGWHNKTVLESLALIASEVGEAADECFGGKRTEAFGEKLADIVLRTADLAQCQGLNLADVVAGAVVEWRSRGLLEDFAEVMVDMAKWMNTARPATLDASFAEAMGRVMRRVVGMADSADVNLEAAVLRKMAINEQRGTRGRRI